MAIRDRIFQRFFQNSINEYISKFLKGDDVDEPTTYESINQETAMKYSAMYACNRVLGETFASVPIQIYKKTNDNNREVYKDTTLYDVLHNKANEEMSPFNFKEVSMTNINFGGNAVCEVLRNKLGDIVGLYPYKWQDVQIERDKNTKRLIYKIGDRKLSRDKVLHVSGLTLDGVMGITPLEYIYGSIGLGLTYQQFGLNFYKNGANTSMVFEHPAGLSEDAFLRLKSELNKNITGVRNTGKPLILEEGMKAREISIKPSDAQLLESKRFQVEDICRIYRVPLHLVQDLSRSTNNNIEHQSLEFIMYTMLPHFKRWEENINMQLLTPAERMSGVYVEFNISGLLRGDAKTRAESYAIGRQWGWLSINDIRRLENMNRIEGGDDYLSPLNMIPVDQLREYHSGTNTSTNTNNKIANEIFQMINKGGGVT